MEIRAKLIYNENVNLIEKIYYSLFKYIFSLCMLYKYILNFLKLNYGKYTGVIYHISNLYLFFVDYKKIFFKIKINNISFFMKTISLKNFSIMLIEDIEGYFLYNDIKKGDIVIDAGAYIGLFTLYASKKVGKNGLVIAYEPDPENYKNLLENIKLNKCKNVKLIKRGIFSKNDILYFQENDGSSTFIFDKNKIKNSKKIIKVPVSSLDSDMKKLGIKKIDFLKADIEGSEIEMIKGAKNILMNSNAKLAIAAYHKVNNKITAPIVADELKKLGYKTKIDYKTHLTVYAWK